jgi:Zn-dependent protease/CBS domain-containing protein
MAGAPANREPDRHSRPDHIEGLTIIGIPIARVLGIEIRVQLGWVIVLALIAVIAVGQLTAIDPALESVTSWILGGIVALGFFVSSVAHDLAHAVVARRRGVDVRAVVVTFFGGSTPLDPGSPDPGDDAAIAASGPLVSITIGLVLLALTAWAFALGDAFSSATGVLSVLVFLNLVLGFVNLIPAYPLDGGRIVRDLVWRRSGSERSGYRAASRSGRITGILVIALGIGVLAIDPTFTGAMIAVTGWFFILSANAVRDRVKVDELVGGHTVGEAMEPDPVTVSPSLTIDTFAAQLVAGESPMTSVPVVEGDEVVGILGVSQVRRIPQARWTSTRVEDAMVKPPKLTFLAREGPLKDALEQVQRQGLDGLPVVEDGRLVGVLTRRAAALFVRTKQVAAPEASTATDSADSAAGEGPTSTGGEGTGS